MAEPEHSKIIAQAAKAALAPIGFRRSGRSRVWLADHGYWLGVVEFQPSGFSKGSYLNVAAHWLWRPPPYLLSFDYFLPDQTRPFIEFKDPTQFTPLAREQAEQAARDSERLARHLPDLHAIAGILAREADAGPTGWRAFHAFVAAGLVGDASASRRLFQQLIEQSATHDWEKRLQTICADLAQNVGDVGAFRSSVLAMVEQSRRLNRLAPAPTCFDARGA